MPPSYPRPKAGSPWSVPSFPLPEASWAAPSSKSKRSTGAESVYSGSATVTVPSPDQVTPSGLLVYPLRVRELPAVTVTDWVDRSLLG